MINILIVDDSVMDQRIAAGLLSKQSEWKIEFANDGQKAWQRIKNQGDSQIDVVLTDLQMPEMNGLELVREVKASFPLLPVILMTGEGSEKIAVEALMQGASSYVAKSNLAGILIETIQQVLTFANQKRTRLSLLKHMKSLDCQFVLSNDTVQLSSLVTHLQDILREMNVLTENERLRTGVALEEALLNAAYHGNLEVSSTLREIDHNQFYSLARERATQSPYQDRQIYVDVKIDQNGIRVCIRDEGPGFDPKSLPDPRDPANLERPCGRGVLLMRTFMDDVTYNCHGNEVCMSKLSHTAQIAQDLYQHSCDSK